MEDTTKIIAVVRGASNVEIQAIFRALADKWLPDVRLAGLVAENHDLADRHCQAGYLRNLTTGARFSIFHDLGPGMAMCHLDGVGAVAAAATVQSDIAAGCDLVLLNKFGNLEIAGDGLVSAFRAAITAGLPLLTSVSPVRQLAGRKGEIWGAESRGFITGPGSGGSRWVHPWRLQVCGLYCGANSRNV